MPIEVDPIRVRELVGAITDAIHRLRELGAMPEAEFLADFRNTESAKYLFIVATEAAIDLCNHIVSRQGGRAPESYADCFTALADLGLIDDDLSLRLRRMARFRNLLVHLYWRVDNSRVYEAIHTSLSDIEGYIRALLDRLPLGSAGAA
ncbi:MAG: DUF86 domain-containing protein [Chloroflexi bacterium]|jgi:uncharacterized protein YutE (UPF0331/DUF86 family)|uniref:DUF86 domain-containing protein n=1 Tax=Candidatus Thermofonsia Clade 3 bacterium TaxID=2364212 RepID=A0A2M8QCY0_9CHLR|nr:DUF86 domain-containing protein [Candidatus Roseilinea sp. NK_OTU-006]PJF47666.1 MAG: DUF86 domain-containing protein [Candidatus Thermofonsia Clade 3 bacterium]RMG63097.1 MAG: DUF86 domain-containing protein [Chloroflexota bacterium]